MSTRTDTFSLHADRWHVLLTTRYVCDVCLTRYFMPYRRCPACKYFGTIYPLDAGLPATAHNDQELRQMMARGGPSGRMHLVQEDACPPTKN